MPVVQLSESSRWSMGSMWRSSAELGPELGSDLVQAPRCPSILLCWGTNSPKHRRSCLWGLKSLWGPKSLLGTQFSLGDKPCLWGSNPFLWSTLAHVAQAPFRGPNSPGGSTLACRAQIPFLGIKSLRVQNPLWGTGLAAMHLAGGEANPFWSPNFACVSQTPHRTKTPFGVQALPVGPKTSVGPKSLSGAKPFV